MKHRIKYIESKPINGEIIFKNKEEYNALIRESGLNLRYFNIQIKLNNKKFL